MTGYAKGTKTSARNSRSEIMKTLARFEVDNTSETNASGCHATTGDRVDVWRLEFVYDGRQVRFDMDAADGTPQQVRERYRALLIHVKAQLVAVDVGFIKPEHAFLMDTLVPVTRDGMTVAVPARFALASMVLDAVRSGKPLPPLLPH